MKRPIQHITDKRAKDLVSSVLPDEWVIRWQSEDYGIDGEIEIFENGESTGVLFKIQLKGTQAPKLISRGRAISQKLRLQSLRYFVQQLRVPVFLFVADTTDRKVWWHSPQTCEYSRMLLDKHVKKEDCQLSIRVDSLNTLPDTLDDALRSLAQVQGKLAIDELASTSDEAFLGTIRATPNLSDSVDKIQRHLDVAKMFDVGELLDNGDRENPRVMARLDEFENSNSTDPEIRFLAIQTKEWLRVTELSDGGLENQDKINDEVKSFAKRLIGVAPRSHPRLRAAARLNYACHLLREEADGDYALSAAEFYAERTQNYLQLVYIQEARKRNIRRLIVLYNRAYKLTTIAIGKHLSEYAPFYTARFLTAMAPFILRLFNSGLITQANSFRNTMLSIADVGGEIARAFGNWDHASLVALNAGFMINPNSNADIKQMSAWVNTQLEKVSDKEISQSAIKSNLQRTASALAGPVIPPDGVPSPEESLSRFDSTLRRYL